MDVRDAGIAPAGYTLKHLALWRTRNRGKLCGALATALQVYSFRGG